MRPTFNIRHPQCMGRIEIDETVTFGIGVNIDATGNLSIGAHSSVSHKVVIITHVHEGSTGPPIGVRPSGRVLAHSLSIGRSVLLGEGAVIMPKVGVIGDWAVIGAYSVLTKPVGPGEIWAGNPARFVRMREGMTRQASELPR